MKSFGQTFGRYGSYIAFQSIVLRESDVPGVKLVYESIEKHSNIQ